MTKADWSTSSVAVSVRYPALKKTAVAKWRANLEECRWTGIRERTFTELHAPPWHSVKTPSPTIAATCPAGISALGDSRLTGLISRFTQSLLVAKSPSIFNFCLIGPILWGHSGPLCHALSLLSLWTSISHCHSAGGVSTVATPGEWQCKIRRGGVRRLAVANGPDIFQMLLVSNVKNDR